MIYHISYKVYVPPYTYPLGWAMGKDWWMSSRPNYKLAVAEDNTVDQLHRMIAQLYDLGTDFPLGLDERDPRP